MTLKELATEAKVSISTVSKALNKSPDISEETKKNILDLAEQYGYRKKYRKKSSAKPGFSGPKIGMIYSDVVSRYYSRLIQAYSDKISSMGGILLACDAQFSNERVTMLCNFLDQQCQVDGIISIMASCDLAAMPKTRAPLLCNVGVKAMPSLINGDYAFDYICINAKTGMTQAIEFLARNGHRDIAYLGEAHSYNRRILFEDIMNQLALPIREGFIRSTNLRFEEAGYRMMREMLQEGLEPTAVICSYDDIAIGASKAINEAGLRIPEDISLIGNDDTRQRIYNQRILSSISSFVDDQVSIGMAMLMKRISSATSNAVQNVSLQTAFMPYETVGPCRTRSRDASAEVQSGH